jgi:Tle cognate immunity protein 4 C-terminal domain
MTLATLRPMNFLKAGAISSLVISAVGCTAQSTPSPWPQECVGRMQLALPGPAEMAVTPNDYLSALMALSPPKGAPKYAFSDGVQAGFTGLYYGSGSFLVSQPLAERAIQAQLDSHGTRSFERAKKTYEKRTLPDGTAYSFALVNTGVAGTSAWRMFGNRYMMAARVGDRLVDANYDTGPGAQSAQVKELSNLIQSLRARVAFDLPTGPGVCLPYVFAQDDATPRRDVAVTYRLNDHPDIQVTLRDASAAVVEPGVRSKNAEPEPATVSFWSQHLNDFKEVKPLWTPSTRPIKLGGYAGLASFVQLTATNGSVEYGYLAMVRGNPSATEDTPDLMLYIVRDAGQAAKVGKKPSDRDEFLDLAQRVAASVKRRP